MLTLFISTLMFSETTLPFAPYAKCFLLLRSPESSPNLITQSQGTLLMCGSSRHTILFGAPVQVPASVAVETSLLWKCPLHVACLLFSLIYRSFKIYSDFC